MLATRPDPLSAAYPTDGGSLDPLARPIPSRVAGRRDPATGATRVVVLDDGRPPRAPPGGPFDPYVPFDWGDRGHGARRLSFYLLVEILGRPVARRLSKRFLAEVVSRLGDRWAMRTIDVSGWASDRGGGL